MAVLPNSTAADLAPSWCADLADLAWGAARCAGAVVRDDRGGWTQAPGGLLQDRGCQAAPEGHSSHPGAPLSAPPRAPPCCPCPPAGRSAALHHTSPHCATVLHRAPPHRYRGLAVGGHRGLRCARRLVGGAIGHWAIPQLSSCPAGPSAGKRVHPYQAHSAHRRDPWGEHLQGPSSIGPMALFPSGAYGLRHESGCCRLCSEM